MGLCEKDLPSLHAVCCCFATMTFPTSRKKAFRSSMVPSPTVTYTDREDDAMHGGCEYVGHHNDVSEIILSCFDY